MGNGQTLAGVNGGLVFLDQRSPRLDEWRRIELFAMPTVDGRVEGEWEKVADRG